MLAPFVNSFLTDILDEEKKKNLRNEKCIFIPSIKGRKCHMKKKGHLCHSNNKDFYVITTFLLYKINI